MAAHSHAPERACNVCERPYRPRRSTSRFCSATCRKRASRGTPAPTAPSKAPSSLRSWLSSRGYTERLEGEALGLTIPLANAVIELNYACRKVAQSGLRCSLPSYTAETLASALVADGFDHRFPEALGRPVKREPEPELA
jgi:hypothetical protein